MQYQPRLWFQNSIGNKLAEPESTEMGCGMNKKFNQSPVRTFGINSMFEVFLSCFLLFISSRESSCCGEMGGGWPPLSDASSWNPNEVQEEETPKEEMKARNKQNLLSMHIFGHISCSMHMEFALEHNVTYQLMFYCIPVPSVFCVSVPVSSVDTLGDLSCPILNIFQLGWLESTMCTSTWKGESCAVFLLYFAYFTW